MHQRIGSIFGSVLDRFVRETTSKSRYDISDYRKFLINEITDIDLICAELNSPFVLRMLIPFDGIKNSATRIAWWDAYNKVKHSDIENLEMGSLANVIYGISSVAIVYNLMEYEVARFRRSVGKIFDRIGFFKPLSTVKASLFTL